MQEVEYRKGENNDNGYFKEKRFCKAGKLC